MILQGNWVVGSLSGLMSPNMHAVCFLYSRMCCYWGQGKKRKMREGRVREIRIKEEMGGPLTEGPLATGDARASFL